MKSYLYYIVIFTSFTACIDPYSFDVENVKQPLVITSYISDVSYNETLAYPSDGRYFTTILNYGQNLSRNGSNISGAQVQLLSEKGELWQYTEMQNQPGKYILLDNEFKAEERVGYKLKITLPNEDQFESDWEVYQNDHREMGAVSFTEAERYKSEFRKNSNKPEIVTVKGAILNVSMPMLERSEKLFYKWEYESTWIYRAGRLSFYHPLHKCYVKGNSYLSEYTIAEDISGGYNQDLVFIEVENNERFYDRMSILVKQLKISKEYYNFLDELNKQNDKKDLFAAPPYNLKTNFHALNNDQPVFGYFYVAHEEAKRMYISGNDFTFGLGGNFSSVCNLAIPPYAPDDPCDDCRDYNSGGQSSTTRPWWWQ